ncbi:MAG: efflux RND transporter periplasmic adaptor subunit [Patescibacteria group bacterium]
MSTVITWIRTHYVWSAVIAVVIVGIGFGIVRSRSGGDTTFETIVARKQNITQTVEVTGKVKPASAVDLAFEGTGRVAAVSVIVGAKVAQGDTLVRLEGATLSASVSEANANVTSALARLKQQEALLDAARAEYDELLRGPRTEERTISATKVARAEQTLADSKKKLIDSTSTSDTALRNVYASAGDTLQDAYRVADDALAKQVDDFFLDQGSGTPRLSYVTADTQSGIDAENQRLAAGLAVQSLATLATVDVTNGAAVTSALSVAVSKLRIVQAMLERLADTLNVSTSLNSTSLATYKANLNTARTNINASISAINSQSQSISAQQATNQAATTTAQAAVNDAEQAVMAAKNELALLDAGASSEKLRSEAAAVKQAEANVASQRGDVERAQAAAASARAELAKATLRAPIAGVVTAVAIEPGEIVSANKTIVSLIGDSAYEVESFVPEAEISKVKIGDDAAITLDAYGSDVVLTAVVTSVDPAETEVEGVATYKMVLQFTGQDERIKSGMTANIVLTTGERTNVLAIPQRAIFSRDRIKYVRVLVGELPEEVKVTTGLNDILGNVEILEGLEEGDTVIVSEKAK